MTNTLFVSAYGDEMTHSQMTQQLMKRVSDLEKQLRETNTLLEALSDRVNYTELDSPSA